MRLTSIKLAGFKSFVEPAHFEVPGQLVGVVGPNGCGKSNIMDAVRWVLGESKASELRGESMQDVIFNGTTHRKPAGRALVELIFDNQSGKAAGQWGRYGEIAVKRTLTREGTSTYSINNQTVRRRDIQDIFLGTGLGPRAYAIIGQGMISRIIEARPEELRVFLEEAAGVSKYKERRRETENRLHDTRENLLRVDDILQEMTTHLEKLQAQAAIAQQFHALTAEQVEKQNLLWLLRKNEAKNEQEKYFRETEAAQTELEKQIAKLRHIEAELEHVRHAHYASGEHLHQAQAALYQTNAEIGSLEAQIKFVIESRTRLQSQINALQTQREQWQSQHLHYQKDLAEAQNQLEEQVMRTEAAQESARHEAEQLLAQEEAWRHSQQQSTESRARITQVQQLIELNAVQQRNAFGILSSLATRRERLTQEKQNLHLPDMAILSALEKERAEKTSLQKEVSLQLAKMQESLIEQEEKYRCAQQQADKEAAHHAQLEARLLALEQIQATIQSKDKVHPWLDKHGFAGLPRLWQKLHIEPGWETALEALLQERVAALEMSNLDWAQAFFQDAPPARLVLYSPDTEKQTAHPTQSHAHACAVHGLTPFFSLLHIHEHNAALQTLMQNWLCHAYVAKDAATAFSCRSMLPDGACLVTQDGHVIDKFSVRFYAPDSEQDGLLARQQEITQLTQQQQVQKTHAEKAKSHALHAESLFAQTTRSVHDARQQSAELTRALHTLQLEVMKQTQMQEHAHQRSMQLGADLEEIAAQEAEQQVLCAESEEKRVQLDAQLAHLQEAHESTQTDYLEKEAQLNAMRSRVRESERAAQEAQFAEKSHRSRIEELKRHIATASSQAQQLFVNVEQGTLELESLDDVAAQAGLQTLLDKRITQERTLSEARHELEQLTQNLRHLDEARTQAERSVQPVREKIVEWQLKEQAARLNQEQYAQQLIEAQADEVKLAEKLTPSLRLATLQSDLTRLSHALAALGAVNLAAVEELSTASERKGFLDAQRADLNEAMTTLQDAIAKIDRETRELLQTTFNKVNQHFGELFPTLFGGGQARLIMTGDEILHAGVQVMAQPPGKKNATIHLLSGGEKALTATALVFSMFQLNPAPFCLLDEVDAPLDDANTERFCSMVKQMSSHTQFLFISHNKIAMEMAQQLIGVTMQEQGVSRIVAVDMASVADFSAAGQTNTP